VEAAEEADRLGADIINTSLGYFDFDNAIYSYSQMNGNTTFISRGAEIAFSRGVVVASAGNSGAVQTLYSCTCCSLNNCCRAVVPLK
jgi:hypothetical protein